MNINLTRQESAKEIKRIVLQGSQQEKLALFTFNTKMPVEKILFKFNLFINAYFIRYLKNKSAPFHEEMIRNLIKSYQGQNYINLAFRGSSKTSYAKLFLVFVLLNDEDKYRRYIKILSRDLKNPKQIVTDVYNMLLELRPLYGDVFEKEGDKKREETMGSFTMKHGVKLTAGTVGQTQRGHVQDAYRPDWILFDDVEDRESISSQVITQGIIDSCDEAITGLQSITGNWCVLGNYISEDGVIQWFINKSNRILQITPIEIDGIPTWVIFSKDKVAQLKKDSDDFFGEYMCQPEKAQGKFFDLDRINQDLKTIAKKPILTSQGVSYWGAVQNHHRYAIGADTSEGVGRDSSALACFNLTTGELMATYHDNQIKPELFAFVIGQVGNNFNNCTVAPEMNNMSGGIVITTLKQNYPEDKIYRHVDNSNVIERESTKYGWHTNSRTKPQMFMDFRRDYNDGLIKIYDENVLKEMKSYNNNDLADSGSLRNITRHFDMLTAVVIAWQMKNYVNNFGNKVAKVTVHSIM